MIAGLMLAAGLTGLAPLSHNAQADVFTPPPLADPWAPEIAAAAERFAIPQAWIRAVMRVESGGRARLNGQPITSSAGAMGLMQIMPKTWADLRQRYALGDAPYAPKANILAGAAYLRDLYVRYGYPALFAAYNAGPRRVDQQLFGGQPLALETQGYMLKIVGRPAEQRTRTITPRQSPLFFDLEAATKPTVDGPQPQP